MKKKVTNNSGVTAIYVRRSVADRDNNSLSIESQKEDCIRYVGEDCVYRLYCDNGFSGKDTEHRPAFQQMMSDAREGLISRIVVKKYDRFSRNLRDYLNVSEELDKLGVSVYSLSEPFNTSSKEGRMMRNNLLNFAEFERETIAGRVADAYDTRGRETGFYQGGTMSFGYTTQRMTVNGKKGSVLVPAEQAVALKLAYEMYAEPSTSLRDILTYFKEHETEIGYLRHINTRCQQVNSYNNLWIGFILELPYSFKYLLFIAALYASGDFLDNIIVNAVFRVNKLAIQHDEKIRLIDLYKEYESRGIYLDSASKGLLQEFFTKLNLIDKKSDSGDAQYVKRIL